jgi:hypothetical protein
MEDQLPSECFILIFMPNESYLESLLINAVHNFRPYFAENINKKQNNVAIMYHSVPLSVIMNDHYKQFMKMFGPNVKHVIDCIESNNEVIARGKGYQHYMRLKLVCPHFLPISEIPVNYYE